MKIYHFVISLAPSVGIIAPPELTVVVWVLLLDIWQLSQVSQLHLQYLC